MNLRLLVEVQNEAHQNEVLNRIEATGAVVKEAHGLVGGRAYELEQSANLEQYAANLAQYMADQPEMVPHMPFLEHLASQCNTILEIGCGHGNGSTRAFERGMKALGSEPAPYPPKLHLIVDVDPERPQIRPTNTKHYKCKVVTGDSRARDTYERVLTESEDDLIDLVYIDTEHTYEVMKAELANWGPLLSRNTLVVFHDTWMFGAYNHMTDAIREWANERDWEFNDFTEVSHGFGLLLHKRGRWAKDRDSLLITAWERYYSRLESERPHKYMPPLGS